MDRAGRAVSLTTDNEKGNPMGMTMIEKILARASGQTQIGVGDTVVCRVDMNVLIDLMFTQWPHPVTIADPGRTAIILDHAVPAPTLIDANAGTVAPEIRPCLRNR